MLRSLPGECILQDVGNILLHFQNYFLEVSHLISSYIKDCYFHPLNYLYYIMVIVIILMRSLLCFTLVQLYCFFPYENKIFAFTK